MLAVIARSPVSEHGVDSATKQSSHFQHLSGDCFPRIKPVLDSDRGSGVAMTFKRNDLDRVDSILDFDFWILFFGLILLGIDVGMFELFNSVTLHSVTLQLSSLRLFDTSTFRPRVFARGMLFDFKDLTTER